jgi:hypothetical protein
MGFYRELLGLGDESRVLVLSRNLWDEAGRVSEAENMSIMLTFTEVELDEVLSSMKGDTTPRPDCPPVLFFKEFWSLVRPYLLKIINWFALGRIGIAHLNFGILTLIPKSPGRRISTNLGPFLLLMCFLNLWRRLMLCGFPP